MIETDDRETVVGVGGLIVRRSKVLMMHRGPGCSKDAGLWDFPSGKLEFGETPVQATVREVLEETGLHVSVSMLLGYETKTLGNLHVVGFTFLCLSLDADEQPRIMEPDKCVDMQWLLVDDAKKLPLTEFAASDIRMLENYRDRYLTLLQ